MDGVKASSARIYQLFSNVSAESSSNKEDSASKNTGVQQTQVPAPALQNTDAVRLSPAVQQEQAARVSKVEELKRLVQSGEYSKQLKDPAAITQVAKKVVEFYSA